MLSQAEALEIMRSGLHNDTYFDKQEAAYWRKHGFKVWGINPEDGGTYMVERGFESKDDALTFIAENDQQALDGGYLY